MFSPDLEHCSCEASIVDNVVYNESFELAGYGRFREPEEVLFR